MNRKFRIKVSKSRVTAVGVAATVIFSLASTHVVQAADLKIATYGGTYMDAAKAAYWEPFQKDTGINIIGDSTDDSMGAIRALAETPVAKWDVMEADSLTAELACAEGLLKPIDKSLLPVADMIAGSVNECTVASAVLATLLVVNKKTYGDKSETMGWKEYFDTKTYPGKRGMTRYIQNVAAAVLIADGVNPKDVGKALRDPGARDRIFAKLDTIKSDLVFYATGTDFLQGLLSGEYSMAFGWNARINSANKETNGQFAARWTAGYSYGMNAYMIPANAENATAAMQFIASTTKPEREATFMKMFAYSGPNTKAFDLLSAEDRALQPANPELDQYATVDDREFWSTHSDEWQQALEAWIAN